jgi:hypothetical protein
MDAIVERRALGSTAVHPSGHAQTVSNARSIDWFSWERPAFHGSQGGALRPRARGGEARDRHRGLVPARRGETRTSHIDATDASSTGDAAGGESPDRYAAQIELSTVGEHGGPAAQVPWPGQRGRLLPPESHHRRHGHTLNPRVLPGCFPSNHAAVPLEIAARRAETMPRRTGTKIGASPDDGLPDSREAWRGQSGQADCRQPDWRTGRRSRGGQDNARGVSGLRRALCRA